MDIAAYRSFIHELAQSSEDLIKPYFSDTSLTIDLKGDQTPVTIADQKTEKTLRHLINQRYPDHGIIGEEFGKENADADFVWVLDPIDGTKTFTSGCPLFGTLICLLHQNKPILGGINLPILNQLYIGDGTLTTLNGVPTRMRACPDVSESTLLLTSYQSIGKYQSQKGFDQLHQEVKMARTWGDCYGYTLLASGFADIMLDPIMNPWDLLALIPVIQGAGGTITDWQGNDPVNGDSIVAATPEIHKTIIQLLNP
jgi:myo-inositol-1(or 4)-monophosphatase